MSTLLLSVVFLLMVYPISAKNTLHILPSYSLQHLKDTASEDYLYGIDFTSRNYAERIGDRFESKVVKKITYRSTRLHSLRLFFRAAFLTSQITTPKDCRNFQVFEIGEDILCYKSHYLKYKNFDSMEVVCASPLVQHSDIDRIENFLRIAPDLDELQRVQNEMLDKKYPKIKYEQVGKGRPDTEIYTLEMLKDYRPQHLPPPYSTWPYRTVIKSLVLILNAIYAAYLKEGETVSLKLLLKPLTNTFFRNAPVEFHHLGAPIKVIRLLKQQADTLEPDELFFIGEFEKAKSERTVAYNGPKPLEPISFDLSPDTFPKQKAILLHSLKEGEHYEIKDHLAVLLGMPTEPLEATGESVLLQLAYIPRAGISKDLLAMNQISRLPFEFGPDPIDHTDT